MLSESDYNNNQEEDEEGAENELIESLIYDSFVDSRGLINYSELNTVSGEEQSCIPEIIPVRYINTVRQQYHLPPVEVADSINERISRILDVAVVLHDQRNGKILSPEDIKQAIHMTYGDKVI